MHAEARLLDLVGAMGDLKAMRNRVLREIESEEVKGKQRTKKVQVWLDKAVDIDRRTNQLIIEFGRCCVTGCCSLNVYSRLNASRKATKLKKDIDELMKEKVHLSVLAKRRLSNTVIDMPISSTNVGKMIGSNLRIVRDCLADKTFGIIGIYGMGGIGKTTLLKEIKRSIGDWNMGFDYVIHARASYELHVEDLRDCIAEQLPLCEPSSRETIFKFLKYKNFLLLLDDLWEELDITVLGIPDPHDDSDATTLYKRKVVFTTRSKQVCDCMKADKKIKLECLDKDEGWQLFKENLAMDLEGMHSIEKAAREVANLCGGLPLALIMVGRAMSNKTSTTEWNFILDQLRGSLSSSLCESMFLYLRSSYDSLANKTLQQCFLCFCLWPKKKLISTEDLVKCWLGFGLISCFDSLSEAYMHGCYILQILEEASLVVTHDNKRVAKVHEIIHDMAQWIALGVGGGSHKPWFVRQNITLKQLSLEEVQTWSQLERVSVVKCDINCLPELQFECPSLLSLNIQHNERLENLPKIFFQQMPNLTYLNLSFTEIRELPVVIMDLCNLEFLDISCTRIISLPNKLGNLKKLKYLFCRYLLLLEELQVELLSSLQSLQVLDVYPYGCVVPQALEILRGLKGVGLCASSNYILEQLSDLPIINISIQHINGLSTLHFGSLTSEEHGGLKELQISFSVAIQNLVIDNKTSLKLLRLYQLQNLGSFVWGIEPKEVFPMLQLVKIEACSSLASLHWVLHLPLLRALVLKDCYTMKELVNGEEREEIKEDDAITTFPKLKYLTIVRLPKLVTISSCALDFPHLSEVHLEGCLNLKRLPFKPDIVNNQGLLIKCERKWWERLEWDDATVRSQFCSNSTEDEEIAEFFVGNVPTEDEEIAEFFVSNVPLLGHKDPPRKSKLHEVGQKDERVKQLKDEDKEGFCVPGTSNEITQLEGDQSQVSLRDVQLPKLVSASYKAVGKGIALNLDIARSYLADETVKMVGIWGMGGVGKTTLLQQIYNSLLDEGNMGFDHVLWVVASQNVKLGKLRVEIAEKLQLASSAGKEGICNVLKTKNFVLLLDDLWDEIDLRELGIPVPYSGDNSTKQYKHKVIFTTRSKRVCSGMGVSKSIKLECLEPDEAWELFKDNIDLDVIESDERIYEIAQQVMNKCGGLPLALKVIGKAISNKKTLEEWEFILRLVKYSNMKDDQGVEGSFFPILKCSYDNLPDRIKECFLCVSMLREPSKDELLECWMGLGLIGDFFYIQEAYNEAEYFLKILEESCLLYFSVDGHVQLHDVIYEMTMWIVSDYGENRNKWIVKEYDGLADVTTNDTKNWRSANRVVIYGIKLLPVLSHQCYDLLCLMINRSYYLKNIPEGFFGQMPKLIYLDLSHTGIKELLPEDIKRLVNLQYLNISSTKISSLPKELVYLKKLQYLICRDLVGLGQVKQGFISSLQKLKVIDLYPYGSVQPEELKILGKHIKAIGMGVESEEVLQQLSCLPTTQLSIQILDSVTSLSFDTLSCKNHGFLRELNIQLCQHLKQIVMNGSETHLNTLKISHVKKLKNIIWRDIRPPEFFHMLNQLYILDCNLDNFAWVVHLPCLFYLSIWHCAKIETLFYIKEENEIQQVSERPTFPALQSLTFGGLPKLVSISNYALDFPRLSQLSVSQCLNVKKLPFKRGVNNGKKINITCAREWWEGLEWDDDAASPSQFSPYYSTPFSPYYHSTQLSTYYYRSTTFFPDMSDPWTIS